MVNAINLLVESGSKLNDAVFNGALSRLRPVLMTASIAALGLVPMLLALKKLQQTIADLKYFGKIRIYFGSD
jgi:Cu/Ag efflux pump CusA